MVNADTKELILDAAEKLFAREGYYGSSIRAITAEAGVNLASINYHFGSKENLLKAVFERRFVPVNSARIERLRSVMEKAASEQKTPLLREIVLAFVEPVLDTFDSPAVISNLTSIMMMSIAKQDETVSKIFIGIMMPVFVKFREAIKKAMPDVSDEEVVWKMHFMIGTMIHTLRFSLTDDIHGLVPHMVPRMMDRSRLLEMLVKFLEAGMEAR